MRLPIVREKGRTGITTEVLIREEELNFLQVLADILQAKVVMDKAAETQGLKDILSENGLEVPPEWTRMIALNEAWIRQETLRLATRYQGHLNAKARRLGLKKLNSLVNKK